ncbi:flagellar hook assembly protein FlgD [Roseibium sp.]|uniref:flagellar hook assembly protein FlgD n=1 Tax=Roseibium sp. TaxID=1936156 RepID=UPI003B526260
MSVTSITQTPQAQAQAGATPIKGSKLTTSDFLQLMVLQLKNQNPTSPSDPNQVMKQMMDLAGYEAQVDTGKKLDAITSSLSALLSGNGLGYIGRTVEAVGDTTALQSGQAKWSYATNGKAQSVKLQVLDEKGAVVFETAGKTDPGKQSFSWDGKDKDGKQLPDGGKYTLKVTALDGNDKAVPTGTTIFGKVTGIDATGDKSVLQIGGISVLMQSVLAVLESK